MPRRKGYGIPPTKRIKIDDENENNENEINDSASENTANEVQKTQIENNVKEAGNNSSEACPNGKYLHKKFKKMAAMLADDYEPATVVAGEGGSVDGKLGNGDSIHISAIRAPLTLPVTTSLRLHNVLPLTPVAAAAAAATATTTAMTTTMMIMTTTTTASTFTQSSLPECTRTDLLAGTRVNNYINNNYQLSTSQNFVNVPPTPTITTAIVSPPPPSLCNARLPATVAAPALATGFTLTVASSGEEEPLVPPIIGRHACPYCKLVCNKPSVLQKHIRAHTNERPYPCLTCGFAFKTRSNLYKHCRSRSHLSKLEDTGEDAKLCAVEEEAIAVVDDEDEEQTAAARYCAGGEASCGEDKMEQPRKSIYKPKFHKAAIYIQNSGTTVPGTALLSASSDPGSELVVSSLNKFGLQLKIPSSVQSSRSTPSTPSSFGGSSPSPEFLHRHISKLISENQAIVETTDPFWSKKFCQRSKESSPPSPQWSSGSVGLEARKRSKPENFEEKLPAESSKLALALLHPCTARSVSTSDISGVEESQPLNLTICKTDSVAERIHERLEPDGGIESLKRPGVVQMLQQPAYEISMAKKPFLENGRKEKSVPEFRRLDLIEIKKECLDSKKSNCGTVAANKDFVVDSKKESAEVRMDLQDTKPEVAKIRAEASAELKKETSATVATTIAAAAAAEAAAEAANVKFVRPTSLPLKPGTFIPKKLIPGSVAVLPLISPETPRPNKSYGQLYIGGNAYTYLGLKCSTRSTFCTLHKSQPTYVPLSPEHNKISMYSNWKVRLEVDPYLRSVPAAKAMACYDSRQRYSSFTVVHGKTKDAVTHSSCWYSRTNSNNTGGNAECNEENKENNTQMSDNSEKLEENSRSSNMCLGKIELSEDYTYVRGRGRGNYVCTECGIRCRKPSMLKKHSRTHTDMRPYRCIHCTFSFKTKGNLTKHMKSKAHYRKCIEMGIVPVPTVVDESYVDEELLSKQAQQIEEGQDLDETEEEEDEDDDDDEDDDNEDDFNEEDPKYQLEREVARSLLSLSKMSHQTVSEQYANAGLVPLNARPNTYPYNYSAVNHASSKANTPTLTLISEQKERETVSKNTGLARELQPGQVDKQKCNPPQNSGRYYFGSPSEKEAAATNTATASDLQESVIKDSATVTTVFPIDLSSKHVAERKIPWPAAFGNRNSITFPMVGTNGISEILTPVSEPVLLATICSTMDRLSWSSAQPKTPVADPTDTSEGSVMLHTYLKERAVQDLKIKQQQYQSPHIKVDQDEFNLKYNACNEAFHKAATAISSTAVTVTATHSGPVVNRPEDVAPRHTPSPKRKNHLLYESDVMATPEKGSAATAAAIVDRSSKQQKMDRVNNSDSKENFAMSPVDSGKSEGGSPSVIILVGSPNSNTHNSAKKLKAEFMSPRSGPMQKYASVLEDGRSKCMVCNKIFSKPSQLRLHVNIHYFEQPFRCEACAVSFRTKGHLHKHLGSNSHLNKVNMNSAGTGPTSTNNPRPFKCDDCSVGFRIHGHLAKHLRSKMHIMKLECLGKLPFGTYAEMERCGINMNEIDTTDCENSLESLQRIAKGVVGSVLYVNNADEEGKMITDSTPF